MTSPHDERRYSDEEFALILRTASEGRGGQEGTPPQEGLTLSQIQEIAAEVGIDPERVSKAAALLPSAEVTTIIRLIGGPPRHRLEHRVPGEVPAKDLGRLVDVARRVLDTQGESREVLGGLEWSGGTATTSARVTVTPRDGETILQASIDGTEAMAGIYAGMGLPVAGVVAVTVGKLLFGETDAGIAAAFLSGLVPGVVMARAVWKRSVRRWRERLLRLVHAMAREAEAYGDGPDANPDALPAPPSDARTAAREEDGGSGPPEEMER